MNIKLAKKAKKIGRFIKSSDKNGNYKNEIEWEENFSKEDRKENSSRVYILTINDEIVKIGGSQDKGGIEGTLSIYKTGGIEGRPSIRSYGVFRLIKEELDSGNNVDIYLIKQEKTNVTIKTMYSEINKDVNINYCDVEKECLREYSEYWNKVNNDTNKYYPIWNFQEAGREWPQYIKEEHSLIIQESLNKGKK